MKTILRIVRFYMITALFVGGLSFGLSLILYPLGIIGGGVKMGLSEIVLASLFNAVVNGLALSLIATAFIYAMYFYNAAKTTRHNRKVRKHVARKESP